MNRLTVKQRRGFVLFVFLSNLQLSGGGIMLIARLRLQRKQVEGSIESDRVASLLLLWENIKNQLVV